MPLREWHGACGCCGRHITHRGGADDVGEPAPKAKCEPPRVQSIFPFGGAQAYDDAVYSMGMTMERHRAHGGKGRDVGEQESVLERRHTRMSRNNKRVSGINGDPGLTGGTLCQEDDQHPNSGKETA